MSVEHLDMLQLDRDTIADMHNFLVGYAEMCMRESGDLPPGERLEDRQRVWARRVEAATSYFEAGQWAMITNPEEAVRLWGEAGRLYRELDFGFGYYLWVTTLGSAAADRQGERDFAIADRLFTRLGDLVSTDRRPVGVPEPLRHPQQQTYLMLAGAIASVSPAPGFPASSEATSPASFTTSSARPSTPSPSSAPWISSWSARRPSSSPAASASPRRTTCR